MNISLRFYIFVTLSLCSQSVLAAWSMEPSYFLRYERNDNIFLATPNNELAVNGGTFSPSIKTIMEEEDQYLVADVDLQFTRYSGEPELDRDEGKAGISWRKSTELSLYGIETSYSKKTNLDTTLDSSGIDEVVEIKTANISPYWQYQFGERWGFSINLSYTDTEYDEPGIPGFDVFKVVNFINYVEQTATLAIRRELSETDSINLSYYNSVYEGVGNGFKIVGTVCGDPFSCLFSGYPGYDRVALVNERELDYDYQVWQLGYDHKFEENSNLSLLAGSSVTDIRNQTLNRYFDQNFNEILPVGLWVVTESEKKGQVYNIVYKQNTEISRLELSAGRNRVASSTGGLDETDTAKIYYIRNFSERLIWSIDLGRSRFNPDQDTIVQPAPVYTRVTASPLVSYYLGKYWTVSLGYIYTKKDIETELVLRESNTVFFNLSWREPKLLSTN